jgi:hypothetical protein
VLHQGGNNRVVASFMTYVDAGMGLWYRGRKQKKNDWHASEVHLFVSETGEVFLDMDHPADFLELEQ